MRQLQEVYPECTDCNKLLTKEEIEINREMENFYYPICDDCLNKAADRVIRIVLGDQE